MILQEDQLSALCMEISMLLGAGMTMEYGLLSMAENEKNEEIKGLLMEICGHMEDGMTFRQALVETGVFPTYFCDMVNIGEQTGNLEGILGELHVFYTNKEALYTSIKAAVVYPFIMVAMMLVVLLVIVVKVLPVFSQVYHELGSEIPSVVEGIIQGGRVVSVVAIAVFAVIVVVGVVSFLYERFGNGKKLFDYETFLMKKTKLGFLIAKSRFASVLAMAFSSGLETEYAMDLANHFVEEETLKQKIMVCKEEIAKGESLPDALEQTGLFDSVKLGILTMGFRSGKQDIALKTIADRYTQEAEKKTASLVSAVEPVLVVSLSIIVGVILLMVMMPLLGIMSTLG